MNKTNEYQLFPAEVIKTHEISAGVFVLSFKKLHDYNAGQVVALAVDLKEKPRLYSIASGVDEKEIRILFNMVPKGKLTARLALLGKGEKLFVSKPFGKFIGTTEPAYWIAAGTGIAPFASMFYSGLGSDKIIIHGGRTLDSFYFQEDFSILPEEQYIRCCSKETGPGVFKGRLTEYLKLLHDLPQTYKYYLCGSAEMVVETRDILIDKGIPFNHIIAEIYF